MTENCGNAKRQQQEQRDYRTQMVHPRSFETQLAHVRHQVVFAVEMQADSKLQKLQRDPWVEEKDAEQHQRDRLVHVFGTMLTKRSLVLKISSFLLFLDLREGNRELTWKSRLFFSAIGTATHTSSKKTIMNGYKHPM